MQKFISNIHPEGYFMITSLFITTITALFVNPLLSFFISTVLSWSLFFFRDPNKDILYDGNIIISPTDGVVQKISQIYEGKDLMYRIDIFLSVFNVHINRIPVSSLVLKLHYIKGEFCNATLDKSSCKNERQLILLRLKNTKEVYLIQIAGLLARRIICRLLEGRMVETGERFGMIKFGSRIDLYIPRNYSIKIKEGEKVVTNSTIIAYDNLDYILL